VVEPGVVVSWVVARAPVPQGVWTRTAQQHQSLSEDQGRKSYSSLMLWGQDLWHVTVLVVTLPLFHYSNWLN
jgi:hypothetical protein